MCWLDEGWKPAKIDRPPTLGTDTKKPKTKNQKTHTQKKPNDPPPPHTHTHTQLPYLLPLLDARPYGRFLFLQYPPFARALAPLGPVNALYHAFPFSSFLAFLAVYQGVARNQSVGRFARFNAAQAVMLDILLM